MLVERIRLKVFFSNPLNLCDLIFTFTYIVFVEIDFTISCAHYACAQRVDIESTCLENKGICIFDNYLILNHPDRLISLQMNIMY